MTTLTSTAPQFTGSTTNGFHVPEKFAAEVISALKLAAAIRNRAEVQKLIGEADTQPNWREGILHIGSTPAAEVGGWIRKHSDQRNGGATRHEVALCNGCKKLVPVSEIAGVTKKENRRGFYGTCRTCWEEDAA